jgi:hypothetical protein
MKNESVAKRSDELRDEYDLSKLKGGVRGKYSRETAAGKNLVTTPKRRRTSAS